MRLNLTVWQRETIRLRVGDLRGSLALMRKGLKVLDAMELTKEEKEKVGYRSAFTAMGQSFEWDDAEARFPIEVKDHEAAGLVKRVVREMVERLERKEAWTPADAKELPNLCEQLKIDLDEVAARIAEEKAEAEAEKKEQKEAKDEPAD